MITIINNSRPSQPSLLVQVWSTTTTTALCSLLMRISTAAYYAYSYCYCYFFHQCCCMSLSFPSSCFIKHSSTLHSCRRTATATATASINMMSSSSKEEHEQIHHQHHQQHQYQQHPFLLPKVIIVGSSNQDLITYTNTIPKLGETLLGERFQVCAGGKGANQGK